MASAQEVAIERAIGNVAFVDVTTELLDRYGFQRLDVRLDHVTAASALPGRAGHAMSARESDA